MLNTKDQSMVTTLSVEKGSVSLGQGEEKNGCLSVTSATNKGEIYVGTEKGQGKLTVTQDMTTVEGSRMTLGETEGGSGSLTVGES